MLVDFIWNVFKSTGSVDSYVLMKEIEEKYKTEKAEDVVSEEVKI
ncbi:YqzL-like protein [Ruminiclostridium sufflavum DSM 19573]|uniref:YqzL-like protein n=1 Tax=Ruminiclostridium sufflavum DSM 19573 TaxID=1121337 RepID=A0A318XNR9_9FIRM|nr:YqzL family protein [Ruminiclostridium sufflavum]PYG88561.1 YqzL-like protein [Ruminiclostridium sufflavum DSM 19573]